MAILGNMLLATLLGASVALGAKFPSQSFETESFKVPSLQINRTNEATDQGYLFFTQSAIETAPIMMTDTNDLVWRGPEGINTQDFRTQTLNNEPVLTFWGGHTYNDPFNHFGHGNGFVIIMDNKYNVAFNICISDDTLTWVTPVPAAFPGTQEHPCFLDRHEAYLSDRGTLIATAFNVTRADLSSLGGPTDGWIFDALFFEIDLSTQKILFSWSALENVGFKTSNYLNQTGGPKPLFFDGVEHGSTQAQAWDFFHINSVQPIPGGYLVNSRMTWSFYKVDGKTGDVIWTLEGSQGGDFTLDPGIFFSWQHMPRLHATTKTSFHISLFNNDNIRGLVAGTNTSSGYLLDVNMDTMHVTALKDLRDPAQGIFSLAEGSFQILGNNSHVLLGYGAEPVIKEFNAQGDVIYTAQFNKITGFRGGAAGPHSYRTFRSVWHGFPTQKPRAVASFPAGQTSANATSVNVFMSWNGATDYDGWTIYAGSSQKTLSKVAQVDRNGFETSNQLSNGIQGLMFIKAEATQGGMALANSTTVRIKSS